MVFMCTYYVWRRMHPTDWIESKAVRDEISTVNFQYM